MKVVVDAWAWLPKSELSLIQLQAIKHALTVRPRKVGDHPGEPPGPIDLFIETEDRIGVPREYFLSNQKHSHEIEYRLTEGDHARWAGPLEFSGSLRPEQEKALQTVVERLHNGNLGGIVRAVPGWGKTVAACALIARLRVPTLVVVHKEFLVNQWQERIEQFLPGARVGRVQQDTCDFAGQHIAIGMVHSLAARDYLRAFYEWPGLIIVDEVHRIGAETWAPVPTKFNARWRVGFSATPRRKDGADNVFFYHIGQVLYVSKEQRLKPKIRRVYSDFHLVKTERFNPKLATKALLLQFLCASDPRNRIINDRLILALEAGRKVIVLSERLQHLRLMEATIRRTWPHKGSLPSTGFYVGGMTEDQLARSADTQCIFATSQLASEGLDIPALDTLFLTTPLSDVEQAVGRILRAYEGKKDPVVVDFRDDQVPKFKDYGETRDKLYRRIA
jgi:superfamily II DNA or RNA helicase